MILLKRSTLLLLTVVAGLLIGGIGVTGVLLIWSSSGSDARYLGEILLFITLVSLIGFAVLAVSLVRGGRRIERDLEKIVSMSYLEGFSPERSLHKLRDVGPLLTRIFGRIDELNRMRSVKIQDLRSIVSFLAANVRMPMLICDVMGDVVLISQSAAECFDRQPREIMGNSVRKLNASLDPRQIATTLIRKKSAYVIKDGRTQFHIEPLFEQGRLVCYVVVCDGSAPETVTLFPLF